MGHWRRTFALSVVLTAASCTTLDQKYGDNKVYQETRELSVKTAHEVAAVTSKASERMKHYMQEQDLLRTFHDAGEHSESAVLDVLHRAGVKQHGATAPSTPGGTRPPGTAPGAPAKGAAPGTPPKGSAPGAPSKAPPSPSAPPASSVPQQYAGTLRWPLDAGVISSEYGERWGKMHRGLDIAADSGEPVYAVGSGQVIYAGDGLKGYGNVVIVRHDVQLTSLYAHNSELKVHQGDHVEQGSLLALLGSTGHSTGPHVHFEIREGDAAVNPHSRLPNSKLGTTGAKLANREP